MQRARRSRLRVLRPPSSGAPAGASAMLAALPGAEGTAQPLSLPAASPQHPALWGQGGLAPGVLFALSLRRQPTQCGLFPPVAYPGFLSSFFSTRRKRV